VEGGYPAARGFELVSEQRLQGDNRPGTPLVVMRPDIAPHLVNVKLHPAHDYAWNFMMGPIGIGSHDTKGEGFDVKS